MESVPRATGVDDRDVVSAAIEIVPIEFASGASAPSLGTWLVSDALGAPQTFSCAGRTWQIADASGALLQAVQRNAAKIHARTIRRHGDSKNFASRITLIDPERSVNRDVLIYMNHPLRYRGETFYQAGFEKDDRTSILQVVHNPSFIAPYIACIVVAAGLLVQFGYHLVGFSRRRRTGARMKRFFPALVSHLRLAAGWSRAGCRQEPRLDDIDLVRFGKIPVLVGGRVKPLDTVARNSLLIIHGKQTCASRRWKTDRQRCNGSADVLFNAPVADEYPVFVIQNAEVLGLFGWEQSDRKYFSFAELSPFLKQIDEQGEQSDKLQSVQRSAYQNAILNLRNALVLYQRLKNSVQPEGAQEFRERTGGLHGRDCPMPRKRHGNARRARLSTNRSSMTRPD